MRGKWLDEVLHYSYSEDLQFMLAYFSDQMIGLNDKLGLPRPDMPLRGREDTFSSLLKRM